MKTENGKNVYYAKDRDTWRKWLVKYHDKESSIWLIIYNKGNKKSSVNYPEAVEEALCFGWIDSKANKSDEGSHYQSFYKRKPGGQWSRLNKTRVKRLIEEGLMTPAGLSMIELAKKTGTWTALDAIEDLKMPADLKKALNGNKTAHKNYQSFPPSSQKIILGWIMNAKRKETREQRIANTVSLAAKNIRANHYNNKK